MRSVSGRMRTVALNPDEAGALAVALARLRHGGPIADALTDLQHVATEAWSTGGEVLVVVSAGDGGDIRGDTHGTPGDDGSHELLTVVEAIAVSGRVEKTIRRAIRDGRLPVEIGDDGRQRVRRGDLERLFPSQRAVLTPSAQTENTSAPAGRGPCPAGRPAPLEPQEAIR